MKNNVTVIIPVYNGEKTIKDCLNSVIKAPPKPKEIIVIDNNSNDRTREIVKTFKNVKLLTEKKRGPAAARNRGLKEVKSKIVIFVDADVIVKKNTFIELLKYLDDDSIAGVGGIPESYEKHNLISLSQDIRLFDNSIFDKKIREVNHIPTMIVAYKTKILKKIGYFNEHYFPSGEDVDLNYRIRKANYKLLLNPSSRVYHNHPLSIKSLVKKWFDYGKGHAKLSKEYKKYFDLFSSIAWIMSLPVLIILSLVKIEFLGFFLLIFLLPWLIFYSPSTIRYLIKNKDGRAFFSPLIHQMQILARSFGILYGIFNLKRRIVQA